jgi:hypothetical protein
MQDSSRAEQYHAMNWSIAKRYGTLLTEFQMRLGQGRELQPKQEPGSGNAPKDRLGGRLTGEAAQAERPQEHVEGAPGPSRAGEVGGQIAAWLKRLRKNGARMATLLRSFPQRLKPGHFAA